MRTVTLASGDALPDFLVYDGANQITVTPILSTSIADYNAILTVGTDDPYNTLTALMYMRIEVAACVITAFSEASPLGSIEYVIS